MDIKSKAKSCFPYYPQLEGLKKKTLVPKTMILPEIDADFHLFLAWSEFMKAIHDSEYDLPNQLVRSKAGVHFPHIYFASLANVLSFMNALDVGDRAGDIGLQLSTTDDTVYIFPDTIDPQWVICLYSYFRQESNGSILLFLYQSVNDSRWKSCVRLALDCVLS